MSTAAEKTRARIASTVHELHTITETLAPMSRTDGHAPCCLTCGRTDALHLIAPGWGGIWACTDCHTQETRP